jgi:hypothetical protein
MQSQLTRKRVRVSSFKFFGGDVYVLRKLTPADFLDEDDGLPLNFFLGKSSEKSMYELTMEACGIDINKKNDKDASARHLKIIKFMLSKCVISENKRKFDVDEFMGRPGTPKNIGKMMLLFSEAIKMSFKRFSCETRIDDSNSIAIFVLSKRFSRPPIEILLPHGDYSEMDAWMFNMYIANIGIKEENRLASKVGKK